MIAFCGTRLVCFLPHFCLPFSFSPGAVPAPAPAAFAASSPRIFEAAMNLNVQTKCQPGAQPASIEMRRTVLHSRALMSPLSPNLPIVTSSTLTISRRHKHQKGSGQLTHCPTIPPSPSHTPLAPQSYRPDSPYQLGARSIAPTAHVDVCIVCCG